MADIRHDARIRGLLDRQHLRGITPAAQFLDVVDDLVGLHGTSASTPYLSLFARTEGFTRPLLDMALYDDRSLVRWRGVRQTVFVVPRALVPVVHAATKRRNETMSRRYLAYRGVSDELFRASAARIVELLRGRTASVSDLRRDLDTALDASATVNLLCDLGVLVRVGHRRHTNASGPVPPLLGHIHHIDRGSRGNRKPDRPVRVRHRRHDPGRRHDDGAHRTTRVLRCLSPTRGSMPRRRSPSMPF